MNDIGNLVGTFWKRDCPTVLISLSKVNTFIETKQMASRSNSESLYLIGIHFVSN